MRTTHAPVCLALLLTLLCTHVHFASADLEVDESVVGDASFSGVLEAYRDAEGTLYVSDWTAGEVIVIDPLSETLIRYNTPFAVGDAKPDAAGSMIWWSDFYGSIGRIDTGTATLDYWDFTDVIPGPFALDTSGSLLWFADLAYPAINLLSFEPEYQPGTGRLCRYAVGGSSAYVIEHNGQVWMGWTGQIVRFDPDAAYSDVEKLRWWVLPEAASEVDSLAYDADGTLWWADANAGRLGRLSPETNQAVTYGLLVDSRPKMLVPDEGVIWYSDQGGRVGFLDPARAIGLPAVPDPDSDAAGYSEPPICTLHDRHGPIAVDVSMPAPLSLAPTNWVAATGAPIGTQVYHAAPAGTQSVPWGIVASAGRLWTVDAVRAVLARTPHLPLQPEVAIARSGTGISLLWATDPSVAKYQVWRSSAPYFRPGDASNPALLGQPAASPFPDPDVPLPGSDRYYVLRAVGTNGLLSAPSSSVGVFSFELVRGS